MLVLYTKYVLLPALSLKNARDLRKELLEQLCKGFRLSRKTRKWEDVK